MSAAEAIVADIRRAIVLLAELNDPAATRVAQLLERWLAGEDFVSAAGLPSDWRARLQLAARDQALAELVRIRTDLEPAPLAAWIVAELRRRARRRTRRDGALGYVDDLARVSCGRSARNLRRLITAIRGQRNRCNGHDGQAPSGALEE
jgi:hypothetical protein